MEHLIEEAFRFAIMTEINSYRTYRNSAVMMPAGSGKEMLERLAAEQRKVIDEIALHCPPAVARIAQQADEDFPHCLHPYPKESRERKLFRQLRAALLDKHCCMEKYTIFAASFRDPSVCKIFELALNRSHKLLDFINAAYQEADLKLHRPSQNRRKKRTHLKPVARPIPNKHTEAYISLLDSGRQTLS